ncbi:hypothetical protein CS238_05385 [Salmonella enterica]|nr:hypothetical protein [Salmonella enterica]EJC8747820.1 hypothetical protein [Salmonella enterica]HCM1648881.1 hypothetical protein [Salmonella enterica subsp. diarizonae serovar 48:i:z35]
MPDFLIIIKFLGAFITVPAISFFVNYFYMKSKDEIQYIEKLSVELKKDNKSIDYHMIEVLFRKIYRSKYVSAEEIIILMSQKNPSRMSFLYAQLNRWLKITEIKSNNGDIDFKFSHGLRKKKTRTLLGCGLLISVLILDVLFAYLLANFINLINFHVIYNQNEAINICLLFLMMLFITYLLILFLLLSFSILSASLRIKNIEKLYH